MASNRAVDAANENRETLIRDLFSIFCRAKGDEAACDIVPRVEQLIEKGVDVDAKWYSGHHEVGHCTIILAAIGQHAQRKINNHGGILDEIAIIEGLKPVLTASRNPGNDVWLHSSALLCWKW